MDRPSLAQESLMAPTFFTSPAASRGVQGDLVPPSHFTSSGQHRGAQLPGTPPISWRNPGATSVPPGDPSPANPWQAVSQAQQEILELRKENQRLLMLYKESTNAKNPIEQPPDLRSRCAARSEQWSRWDSEWFLEAERHKAEAERLKREVEALKDTAGRHRDEMRDRENTVNRQCHELEAIREELCKTKTELSQVREELIHSTAQKEKMCSQLEKLQGEFSEEFSKLRRDVERSKEESLQLALRAETDRLQADENAKQLALKLEEMQKKLLEVHKEKEGELEQLTVSHSAELGAAQKTNSELQDRLQSMGSEVLQLKSALMEVSSERNGLKEHLSQMGQAFETQSATLHSLRNYIGQLAPDKGEKERLNDAVERLTKEKAALQMTTELLTVRLNSVNEILALQEEKMIKKTSTDPLVKTGPEGLQVLKLWREKVFKLCVQLRSKDIEVRGEKNKLLSAIRSAEQQLQQEQHQASVLQHSLDDRIAELDLERVEKETLKQDLIQARRENSQLKSRNQNAEAELNTLHEAVQRFRLSFESKAAEVAAAQTRLNALIQRLTFAKGRVEAIQGLVMRRTALRRAHQAGREAEQAADSIANLQTELSLVCEERDKLTQELKRTPELIERSLADLKEQYESRLRQQQQGLEQSWAEVRQAVALREEAEQSLQQVRAQLEESREDLETLRSELLGQQEHSQRALQERVSEITDRCAEKLREMETQVNTAQREHTKAVITLRHFEREAAKKMDELRKAEHWRRGRAKSEASDKQLGQTERDKSPLLTTVAEGELASEHTRAHTEAALNSAAGAWEHQDKPSEISCSMGGSIDVSAEVRLLSVLEELRSLSAAVVNSSEDSAEEEEEEEGEKEEEEGQSDSVGPSTGSLHS